MSGAETAVVPLFPLSHVLLPGMPLPLHIFEQRYRDLLTDVVGDPAAPGSAAFGVVALRSGTEAQSRHVRGGSPQGTGSAGDSDRADERGGPAAVAVPDVNDIGTLAEILEVEPGDDGTSDLLSVGSRRFRVLALITEGKPYLRAEVEFLDEIDGDVSPDQAGRARELIEIYDAVLTKLAGRATGAELPTDVNQLSYHIAARLPLPPDERQDLLRDDTTAARLERVARLLRREIALLRGTRSIAVSPAVLRMVTGVN